mmetsp:Transcript_36663/g.81584  ORF Transcript_36663/g.81584 Transcript_36663/m.81584 type:complete len:1184 (-) Transcript_36663:438-3989(-)|eukprot:CAMPEP_0202900658 /NCGR_PEP_ID=MMETSP1392-20130828/11962_1 /ASSEMBLY_ACC=CAM_ASM_000868 /TAXON_ID=225041 /ORGANISM="Chlamydomonas chlamydogama, Strain SAG 11-48b" /LENGTH=1183 /DNA_ID=CAMNT_0049587095 /DNA_START=175 /DNA_END=3726 /DNA_ORIENTATION=-
MAPLKLYGTGGRVLKADVVAVFAGVDVVKPPFTFGVTNKTPWFLKMNPNGKVPVLATPNGAIFESNTICRYLASIGNDKTLYPAQTSPEDLTRAHIDQWLDWSTSFEDVAASWMYVLAGMRPLDAAAMGAAQKKFAALMAALEAHMAGRTWLVGSNITLADIVVAMVLLTFYVTVMDDEFRAKHPNSIKLLEAVYSHPRTVKAFKGHSVKPPAKPYEPNPAGGPAWGTGPHPMGGLMEVITQPWSGARTRAAFNEFFETKGHTYWASSSVVPHNDPTLLFTNAGMNQFKPVFLGTVDPNSEMGRMTRACNSQKCIRAGGKHNDLDDVGKDVYHHTFFEMLGNWSFGDYFKEEAISWAWELLTQVYRLPPERLYATYFQGDPAQGLPADEEAKAIWLRFLPESRVLPYGCKENFWEMGDQGPCGPCTEIHFDRIGGRDAAALVNADDPNVLEIWNNVFIQFNREPDGSLKSLPAKHVDTGMGLERITSVLQGKMSNYATDLFSPIFDEIQRITGARTYTDKIGKEDTDGKDMAYRVVADHIRTLSFSIADGARPGNEGRDYVLRRILRRAVRYGRETLGAQEGFFAQLVDVVVKHFGSFFPELVSARDVIYNTIREEEASFSRTLVKGIERFKKAAAVAQGGVLSGEDAFLLWDTFGFPVDLTELMAEEQGLKVDKAGFEKCFEEAREKSKAASKKTQQGGIKFEAEATGWLQNHHIPLTDDLPKYTQADVSAKLLAILTPSGFVDSVSEGGDACGLVLDTTSFYAESGGQVSDTGSIAGPSGSLAVRDSQVAAGFVLHVGEVSGSLRVGDAVKVSVDYGRRNQIMPNHTFTHVLNFALRNVLGEHVDQKGSIVMPDKLRFDFSNNGVVESDKLGAIESICRDVLSKQLNVFTKDVALAQAKEVNGLRAVFGEVYPDPVRVVCVGRSIDDLLADPKAPSNRDFSIEFCGGTHLSNTSQARAFALISEEGIAKGIRRIVAYTGEEAEKAIAEGQRLAAEVAAAKALPDAQLEKAVATIKPVVDTAVISAFTKAQLRDELAALQKRVLEAAKAAASANKTAAIGAATAAGDAAAAAGKSYIVVRLDVGSDNKALTEAWNALNAKHPGIAAVFLSPEAGDKPKVMVYAGVPEGLTSKLKAGDWASTILKVLDGKGGGKPTVAQGQGPAVEKLEEALKVAEEYAGSKF